MWSYSKLLVALSILTCLSCASCSPNKAFVLGNWKQSTTTGQKSFKIHAFSKFIPLSGNETTVVRKELDFKSSDTAEPGRRGDLSHLTPFQFFVVVGANICYILSLSVYHAVARTWNNAWYEVVYTFDLLRGVHRNRTSESIIAELLHRPEAVLYFQADDGDQDSQYYDFYYQEDSWNSGCRNVLKPLRAVEPTHKCVRLFQEWNCRGRSLAVYPGSEINHKLTNFTEFHSIGKCLSNEFEFSTFYDNENDDLEISVRKNGTNSIEIPDLIEFSGAEYLSPENVTNQGPRYVFDHKKRLSWAAISIDIESTAVSINRGSKSSRLKDTKEWKEMEKRRGDDLGFIIPPELGGSLVNIQNAFPQSKKNLKEWQAVEQSIISYLQGSKVKKNLDLSITLAYDSERTTRPSAFYYHALFWRPPQQSSALIRYDCLKN